MCSHIGEKKVVGKYLSNMSHQFSMSVQRDNVKNAIRKSLRTTILLETNERKKQSWD